MKQNKNGRNIDARSDAAQKEMVTVIATVNNIVGTWSRENPNKKWKNTKVLDIYANLKRAAVAQPRTSARYHPQHPGLLMTITRICYS